jgi:REP element-mobilizing transposase RayT
MVRGIERRNIFRDDTDREEFLGRLAKLVPETQTACYAWVLTPNHAHLLLRTGRAPLPTLMQRLLTGYAVRFNHRHKRHGLLFQNRYKSVVCQEERYFQELVRYIHLNPVRAGIVATASELSRYPYGGHSALLGKRERPWQATEYVLLAFGKTVVRARKVYGAYVEAGMQQGRRAELMGGGLIRSLGGWAAVKDRRGKGQEPLKSDERILGETDFVEAILAQATERYTRQYALQRQGGWMAASGRAGGRPLPDGPAGGGGERSPAAQGDRAEFALLLGRAGVGSPAHGAGPAARPEPARGELCRPTGRDAHPRQSLTAVPTLLE